ncbi:MAG: hypothetical protein JSV66_17710 [Trueperaceae bacterium]|nr:MAG: hypothetical protein JSV66_17710 [Trueperaceae bacterium]
MLVGIFWTLIPTLATTVAAEQMSAGAVDAAELLKLRRGYLAYWRQLGDDPSLDGAERFGCLVQHVVDETIRTAGFGAEPEEEVKRRILDHLVDILVPPEYRDEKEFVMETAAVIESGTIVEMTDDLAGFRIELQRGDGRFRHFAMNAAAAYQVPDLLVDLAARLVGRDFDPTEDPSGDSAADLLTNEIGREFATFLEAHSLSELAETQAVKVWLVERFGRR